MEELKLELKYQREIGFGQLSGCFQPITSSEDGQLVEKLILWNQEVMLPHIHLEVLTNLPPLYIGDQTGLTMLMLRHTKLILTLLIFQMTSIPMDSTGTKINFIPTSMTHQIKYLKLISPKNQCGNSENSQHHMPTHGLMNQTMLHSTENSI